MGNFEYIDKKLNINYLLIFNQAIKNLETFIVKLNTDQQLMRGLDAEGIKISPKYRNPAYARKKAGMNSRPGYGTPDFKLTGQYHDSFFVEFMAKGFSIEVPASEADLDAKLAARW